MDLVLKSENRMSWSSAKFLVTKNKLLAPLLPSCQAVVPNTGWFSGMYSPKHVRLRYDVTMSKEGAAVEETQDMGGGWCPGRDQA